MLELILKYLLDEAFVNRCIWILGIAGPPVGALAGYLTGRVRARVRSDLVDGTLIGLFGTLTLVMWHVYNAIVEWLGLDTVKNLVFNLALFTVVGLVLGIVVRHVRPRLKGEPAMAPASLPPAAPPPGAPVAPAGAAEGPPDAPGHAG